MNNHSSSAMPPLPKRTISIAPMLDWTDRHCRVFHRTLTHQSWLYTEMVTTGALLHGDVARHLDFSEIEHPLALQLGGNDPNELAQCALLAEKWGYDEINLNCGCPSERVQKGTFGACLMAAPELVAQCVRAMRDSVSIDITIKHRIGIDQINSYDFVCDFVGTVADAGCKTFIVHARNAILKGLSPKENREIPPLKYDFAYQLKRDFPALEIILNGAIRKNSEIRTHLQHVDGVMLGREAYHNPYWLAEFDYAFYGDDHFVPDREGVLEIMGAYLDQQLNDYGAHGLRPSSITRHMMGLMSKRPGARAFRQILSDPQQLVQGNSGILRAAQAAMQC